jgi:arylsulfatase A-like enzyme
MQPSNFPGRLALILWVAGGLALARVGIVFGLEFVHHGDLWIASQRALHICLESARVAFLVPLFMLVFTNGASRGLGRGIFALGVAIGGLGLLSGFRDDDRSRRIGIDTDLGQWMWIVLVFGALAWLLACSLERPRWAWAALARARHVCGVPLGAVLFGALASHLGLGALSDTMPVRCSELSLIDGRWETLRARPDAAVEVGLLSPSAKYRVDGAARPGLVLAPPALVRRSLHEFEGQRFLVGGAGVDQVVAEELAERMSGHRVRFRVRVEGAQVFEAERALSGASTWAELGAGVSVRGGARIELETALLGPNGAEVTAEFPIRAGFGGLALERHERLARATASPQHPNLVLVLIDTLRADRTSAYDYARPTTTYLAGLAARGALFEEAYATASWTWPSTASILTGLYPEEHGVQDATSSFLAPDLDTLAEALQRAGVTTGAWSGSPLIVPDKGFDQGFEFFDASREGRLRRSDLLIPSALEWLAKVRTRRFFLYLHLMEPHAPFQPLAAGRTNFAANVPRDYDPRKVLDYNWELLREGFGPSGERRTASVVAPEEQRWISDLYDGCVWSADDYLGQVLQQLQKLGLTETTVVAVTSDHGEELFDHGLLTHGNTLHRELVRVPLIVAGPGVPRGVRVSAPLSLTALGPGLAHLCGASLGSASESGDLFAPSTPLQLFSTHQGWWNGYARQPLYGLREGSRVLHLAPRAAPWGGSQPGPGEVRLYDLEHDPLEREDLATLEPERAQAMHQALLVELERLGKRRAGTVLAPDPATLERMRGLGYVGK